MKKLVGMRDRYTLLEPIGEGGSAVLYRAVSDSGVDVCLKRFGDPYVQSLEFVAGFECEIGLTDHHPNVVQVLDYGEDPYFLCMELVDGVDLMRLVLEAGPLPAALVLHIGADLAKGLAHVHRTGPAGRGPLIHCDVTPHNVLLSREGAVKLSDFGVAKPLSRTGATTITRERGKEGFLSPEQIRGQRIDSRSDLFVLGLTLWWALVGAHPYTRGRPRGELVQGWVRAQTRKNERPHIGEVALVPDPLANVIEELLQPLPKRAASAAEVGAALSGHVPPGAAAQLASWIARVPSMRLRDG